MDMAAKYLWVALGSALGGVGRYHLYIKLRKTQHGESKNVLLGAFAAHYDIKLAVVVDPDVDIHDPAEVEWAIATRFQADRDTVILPTANARSSTPQRMRASAPRWASMRRSRSTRPK